jgi:hypothetical protein
MRQQFQSISEKEQELSPPASSNRKKKAQADTLINYEEQESSAEKTQEMVDVLKSIEI